MKRFVAFFGVLSLLGCEKPVTANPDAGPKLGLPAELMAPPVLERPPADRLPEDLKPPR